MNNLIILFLSSFMLIGCFNPPKYFIPKSNEHELRTPNVVIDPFIQIRVVDDSHRYLEKENELYKYPFDTALSNRFRKRLYDTLEEELFDHQRYERTAFDTDKQVILRYLILNDLRSKIDDFEFKRIIHNHNSLSLTPLAELKKSIDLTGKAVFVFVGSVYDKEAREMNFFDFLGSFSSEYNCSLPVKDRMLPFAYGCIGIFNFSNHSIEFLSLEKNNFDLKNENNIQNMISDLIGALTSIK